MGRKTFTVRVVVSCWNRLAGEVVDAPSLEALKVQLGFEQPDRVKDICAHSKGLGTRQLSMVPYCSNHSVMQYWPSLCKGGV